MLWSSTDQYKDDPFDVEADLEAAITGAASHLFGPSPYYLDVKTKIGAKGGKRNIPDGYLIDLATSCGREPEFSPRVKVAVPRVRLSGLVASVHFDFSGSRHQIGCRS